MNHISLPSPAKINLCLSVLGKRPDGYHTIESLMQTLDFGDTVYIATREDDQIILASNRDDLPLDEGNIAYRAAALMRETYNIECGFTIGLEKHIPIAAGLAGGSGNAAAVLHGINRLCGLNLMADELAALGLKLGADVPFCLYGRPALCEGIGEILTPAAGLSVCYVVLVNPGTQVSTGQIYQSLDSGEMPQAGDVRRLIGALEKGSLSDAFGDMVNMMEPAAKQFCPQIQDLIDGLYKMGADHAMMSGSGATCFGIFTKKPDEEEMKRFFGDSFVAIAKPIL